MSSPRVRSPCRARIRDHNDRCEGGDWESPQRRLSADLGECHEYSVEWLEGDLVFRLDGDEVYRLAGRGDDFAEPFFAILNFAKINDAPMTTEAWTMEVDWVKHETRD